jgi:O-methyltransferase
MNIILRILNSTKYRFKLNLSNFIIKLNKKNSDLINFNYIVSFFMPNIKVTYIDTFNFATRMNASCVEEDRFLKSIKYAQSITKQKRPLWTSYNLIWAALNGMKLEGDFVELGVEKGFHSLSIIHYLKDANFNNRKFYLMDSWEGVDIDSLETAEIKQDKEWNKIFTGFYNEVTNYFKSYSFVIMIKGFIPATLQNLPTNKIAFLHIDLNSVNPEIDALEFLWDKITKGAIVILDDYNQTGREIQKDGIDELGKKLNFNVLCLPTGQGLILKN